MLPAKLIECHDSPEDAYMLVVRIAIGKSSSSNVAIVGEDVDLSVLRTDR